LSFFGLFLEFGQGVGPETIEVVTEHFEAVAVETIETFIAVVSTGGELCTLEHSEVLRHGRPTDRKPFSQAADRQRAVEKPLDDGAAG
jgi:hypothetical protein